MRFSEEDFDDFIKEVVSDPGNPPRIVMLGGLLGKSSEADCVRLYLDTTLQSFVDIPDDAIVFHQKFDKASSPMGGSRIWVKADANVAPARAQQQKVTAEFLGGNILRNYAQGAAKTNAAGTVFPRIPPSWIDGCPTQFLCNPTVDPTLGRTIFGPGCISAVANTCDVGLCFPEDPPGGGGLTIGGATNDANCESHMILDCLPPDVFGRVQAQMRRNFWRRAR